MCPHSSQLSAVISQRLVPQPHNTFTRSTATQSWIVCFLFYSSGRERTTIIIIHHTIVRVEPDPMTAIQGGVQRPSDSPPTPITGSSDMTQTPLMGGLLSPVTLSATRRPLLVPHKATGGATTQTRTTNVLPTPPPIQRLITQTERSTAAWLPLKTSFTLNGQTDRGWRRLDVSNRPCVLTSLPSMLVSWDTLWFFNFFFHSYFLYCHTFWSVFISIIKVTVCRILWHLAARLRIATSSVLLASPSPVEARKTYSGHERPYLVNKIKTRLNNELWTFNFISTNRAS